MNSSKPIQQFQFSDEAKKIHQQLSEKISLSIEDGLSVKHKSGGLSFSNFMQMAMYEPSLGYYKNNLHKFGKKGDFITAPEMGKSFAKCIARSIHSVFLSYSELNSKKILPSLMEIGAGSGRLAVDLLSALDELNALPTKYFILETSAELQSQQKQLLTKHHPEFMSRIEWLTSLPEHFDGVIFANEVVDAIPFELIRKVSNKWLQLGVRNDDGVLKICELEAIAENKLPEQIVKNGFENDYIDGYTTEYRPLLSGWIAALADCLRTGAILLVDYGYCDIDYYHYQRTQGTLCCFVNHHSHDDPLQLVGLQDITCHVDFSHIKKSAEMNDLQVTGFTTQAGFLLENGITEMGLDEIDSETETERYQRSQELQKLLMPGQMGEVIKVMLLEKSENLKSAKIKGFSFQDHLYKL